MSKLIVISIMILSACSSPQTGIADDYFDLNLKNRPKKVISISNFPFHAYFQEDMQEFLDSSLISQIQIHHMYFDTLGRVSYEYSKFLDEELHVMHNYDLTYYYKDSIEIFERLSNGNKVLREKLYLNKTGYFTQRIRYYPLEDTLIVSRSGDNMISEWHSTSYGIDTHAIIKTQYIRNSNGDIINEKKFKILDGALWNKPDTIETENTYKYIYDDYKNWIIRLTLENGKIQKITSRQFEY